MEKDGACAHTRTLWGGGSHEKHPAGGSTGEWPQRGGRRGVRQNFLEPLLPQTPTQPVAGGQCILEGTVPGGCRCLTPPFPVSHVQVLPSAPRQRQQEPEAGGLGVPAAERGIH